MKTFTVFATALTIFLGACTAWTSAPVEMTAEVSTVIPNIGGLPGTEAPFVTPEPPTPLPTIQSAFSPTELKYRVLDEFPDFFFCDPDYFPVGTGDEMGMARQRFPQLQENQEEFQAILARNGLEGLSSFIDEQKLLIYRDHKKLAAVYFELAEDKFQFQVQTGTEGQSGFLIKGTIDGDGKIDIQQREDSFPTCPICLAENTLIDTPQGVIAVQDLQVGDAVWTMNAAGARVPAVISKTAHVTVPANHQVIHVVLADGRELWASPGHPTADGRRLADLKTGDILDGSRVILINSLSYEGTVTYDILPSGVTGFYWANGILMGSTLMEP